MTSRLTLRTTSQHEAVMRLKSSYYLLVDDCIIDVMRLPKDLSYNQRLPYVNNYAEQHAISTKGIQLRERKYYGI